MASSGPRMTSHKRAEHRTFACQVANGRALRGPGARVAATRHERQGPGRDGTTRWA